MPTIDRPKIEYYENPREDLIRLIPAEAKRILDVGCGLGLLGKLLKNIRALDIEIVGIEQNRDIAERAGANLDKVLMGDVEEITLPFSKEYFDCIIYGDILEHLYDPWKLLAKHCGFLRSGGYVIASIPNIAHYRIVKMLRHGKWNYEGSGILDRSHIRFFTKEGIRDMFAKTGLKIERIERKMGGSRAKKLLNKILLGYVSNSITEQYIILAKKP